MQIEEYIPYGWENAISRYDLADMVSKSDRETRELIERAIVDRGVIILNMCDGNGYFRPRENNKADYDRAIICKRREEARWKSVMAHLVMINRYVNNSNPEQMNLEEVVNG